jgi:transcriptional regulator with XRE-family HTH domain
MRTFGDVLRDLRKEQGLSLRALGRLVHYSGGYVHQLETGARHPPARTAQVLDRVLGAGGRLADLAAAGVGCPAFPDLPTGAWRNVDAETLADALIGDPPTAESAVRLAHLWLATPAPQVYELASGRRIGMDLVERVERRVHQIRLLDDHIGGRDSLAVATAELSATSELIRQASASEAISRRLLSATAELCQIAGWIAADAGLLPDARRAYLAGVRAGHAAGDPAGAASNLSSLAYATANDGDPVEAVLMARGAVRGADDVATPTVRALLRERLAWAYARSGDIEATARTLAEVDEASAARTSDNDPLWVYWLTAEEIEVMAGRCWTQLRRPLRAVPALEHALAAYRDDLPRESALYLTWLAEALVYGGEVEQAADMTGQALHLADGASHRVEQRIDILRRMLAAHRNVPQVSAFLGAYALGVARRS